MMILVNHGKAVRFLSYYGQIPEWPKGADCKSVSYAFEGSNPSPPIPKDKFLLVGNDLIFYE